MYSNKDLEFLKQQYMKQDYPDDLNDHILTCIAKASLDTAEEKISNKRNWFFRFPAVIVLVAAVFFVITKEGFNGNNDVKTTQQEFMDSKITRGVTHFNDVEDSYQLFENDVIVSIYPNKNEVYFSDAIYNIDKIDNKVIHLNDILKSDINYGELDKNLNELLRDESTKFYVDTNGTYIFIGNDSYENNMIILDKILESKILKDRYVFK